MEKSILKNQTKILRLAHYNIFKGGEKRIDDIFTVIREINADIIGMLEAVSWQKNNSQIKKNIQKSGYKFYKLAIANSKYNIAILSKIPVYVRCIKNGFRHTLVQVLLKEGKYKGFCVFFVHLSPVSEEDRLKELEKVLEFVSKFPKSIIMGDFNSLSPHDTYNKEKLLSFFKNNNITKFGKENLCFEVISKIESYGLIDAMIYLGKKFDYSVPTPYNTDINHSMKIRVDYGFLSKKIIKRLCKTELYKTNISNLASDHYPFFLDIK